MNKTNKKTELEYIETQYGVMEKVDAEKLAVLKQLVTTYYGIQKTRIGMGNRISGIVKEYGETENTAKLLDVFGESEKIEKAVLKHVKPLLREYRIYTDWLIKVRGIGPVLAAGFISGIKTPARFENISKLWRYCGYAVIDGETESRKRGDKLSYSPFLKTMGWKAGESFVKIRGFYREAYEQFRSDEERKNEEGIIKPVEIAAGFVLKDDGEILTKAKIEKLKKEGISEVEVGMTNAHIYARAKRKTVKLFLAHLWQVWREIEELPVTKPYANTILGHENFIKPPYWK